MKSTFIKSYPAYDIYSAKLDSFGRKVFPVDAEFSINGHGNFQAGNVMSSALKYNDCPIKTLERAISNGHNIYYIMSLGTCINNDKKEKTNRYTYEVGDIIFYCGKNFMIEPLANNNFGLQEIK